MGSIGSLCLFAAFLLLSFITFGNRVIITLAEIIGILTLIYTGTAIYYIRNKKKWLLIATAAFLIPWLIYSIGYEIGITMSTNLYGIWFVLFYAVMIASFIFMKKSYPRIQGLYKLFPVFFIYFNSMLLLYMAALNVWWLLPRW